jgi:DNA repair protein RadC
VDVKAILRRALDRKATGVILVHNHPSGNALPGQADIRQTGILRKALQTCEINLLDHVVIAEDSWYSFADEQLVTEKF